MTVATTNNNPKFGPISECKRTDHHTHSYAELRLIRWAASRGDRDAWLFTACHQWPAAREIFEKNWGMPPLIEELDDFEEQVYDLDNDAARAEEWINEAFKFTMEQYIAVAKRPNPRNASAQAELQRITTASCKPRRNRTRRARYRIDATNLSRRAPKAGSAQRPTTPIDTCTYGWEIEYAVYTGSPTVIHAPSNLPWIWRIDYDFPPAPWMNPRPQGN